MLALLRSKPAPSRRPSLKVLPGGKEKAPEVREIAVTLPPLHELQQKIVRNRARYKVLVCGRRWGKTRLGAWLSLKDALEGKRVWWVAPTYPQAKIAWRILRPLARAIPDVDVRVSEKVIFFPGGGEIWIKSSDRPDNLRGEGVDLLVMDEADYQEEATWTQVLRPALADRKGSALFISTPRQDGGWFHKLYERGQRPGGTWASWCYPSVSNPYLDPAEIEEARDQMHDLEFRREFGAEFVATPGAVYSNFSRTHHVRHCPYTPGLKLYIGCDFNNSDGNPMTSALLQRHGEEFWVIGEIVTPGTTEEHAANLARRVEDLGIKKDPKKGFDPALVEVIPDASGKSGSHSGVSDHEYLRRAGFTLNAPSNNPLIKDRDNAVLGRLQNAKGERRLFFDPSARQTIESFASLLHKGRGRSPWSHLCDCVGYVIHRLAPVKVPLLRPDPVSVPRRRVGKSRIYPI